MLVTYKDFSFDTDAMRQFATGVAAMPRIFVTESGLCFLEKTRRKWETARVSHLRYSEAVRYSETFKLGELKAYILACRGGAPADTLTGMTDVPSVSSEMTPE